LENPQNGSFQSGVGLISGWKCSAGRIDLVFDNAATVQASYGTSRLDTRPACGDDNNGFGYLINWNDLGDGQHTIVAKADGVEFAHTTFTVVTLGTDFLRGASGQCRLPNFPQPGLDVVLGWQESTQNFVLQGVIPGGGTGGSGGGSCPTLPIAPSESLEGAGILAADDQFLGLITMNCYSSDALCNEFGTYGSDFSSVSILNRYGTYGSQFSSLSPFNPSTFTPPVIFYANGIPVAYLTLNTALSPRVDPYALIGWLKVNE
jgi:hypothetical protein